MKAHGKEKDPKHNLAAEVPSGALTAPKRVLVALWMNGVFGPDIMEGIHRWLRKSGVAWRIRFADSEKLFASSLSWMLREGILNGVISFFHDPSKMEALHRAGVPLVLFGEYLVDSPPDAPLPPLVARVDMDLAAIARAAADHFQSRADFRSAGYVECQFDHGWSRHRGDAVVAEFKRRGIETHRFLHYGRPSDSANPGPDFEGLARWLRDLPKPAAVVAANDATADEVIRLCKATDIAVPRDVAVLGMDDNPVFCQHSEPNISSVHFDGHAAGQNAACALAAMMDGAPVPDRATLRYGATVAKRGSTAATPSIGEVVQKALDFIDANACSGATLSDVVRHCRYSRTLVTLRFRQMTGMSVEQAIRARRLDEVRRLLRETSLSAEEIAPRCGYENVSALRRAFVRDTGLTMGAWRRANADVK